jgi:hypothetical protein
MMAAITPLTLFIAKLIGFLFLIFSLVMRATGHELITVGASKARHREA